MDLSSIFNAQTISLAVLGVTSVAGLLGSVFNNKQQEEILITRFGKHIRTVKEAGIKAKIPFIDKIEKRIGMDVQQVTETLKTKTVDDLFVDLPIAVQFQVVDTAKFYFQNRDAVANMKKVVSAAVRTATAGKQFQELYGDRDGISDAVISHIRETVSGYGLSISKIIIDEPAAPAEVQAAFNEVRASERAKEAARNKAEAHKIEIVAKAQAEKEADELRGQGKANFRKAIFDQYREQIDALSGGDAARRDEAVRVMMEAMRQDTLRDVGEKGNLVIVAENASGDTGKQLAQLQTIARRPGGGAQAAP